MANDPIRAVMSQLGRAATKCDAGLSDAALLARFVGSRDEAAFEVLVWRHGGLVRGVARRWLGDSPEAEDAFQAVFLTLARKARSIRPDSLAGWLHRVACRIAWKANRRRAKRKLVEVPLNGHDVALPDPTTRLDLPEVIDREIDRLPDSQRLAVVMCYLQGRSTAEAASELGCPRGTVLSRLAAARSTLAKRLARRGVAPAVLISLAESAGEAAPPGDWVAHAVRIALAPASASSSIVLLSNGVIQAMFWKKCRTVLVVGLVAGMCGLGVGVGRADRPEAKNAGGDEKPRAKTEEPPAKTEKAPAIPNDPVNPQELAEKQREVEGVVVQLTKEIERRAKLLLEIEDKMSHQRRQFRSRRIASGENMRELEFRQNWQREQMQRSLANLDATLQTRKSTLPQAQATLQNVHAEMQRIEQFAKSTDDEKERAKALTQLEVSRTNVKSQAMVELKLKEEIGELEKQIESTKNEVLGREAQRTKERITLRQEMAAMQDEVEGIERRMARERETIAASVAELESQLRRLRGTTPEPSSLERKIETLMREIQELRREVKGKKD